MRVSIGLLSCAMLALLLTGCGSGRSDPPPDLVSVSGTITLDGEPVEGVGVLFSPVDATGKGLCYGNTDETGHYELTDSRGGNGASVGEYRVTCSKWVLPDGTAFKSDTESPMEAGATQSLPAKYSDDAATELKATVAAGSGTIDFELKSK